MPGRSRRARRLTRAENLIREFIKFKEKRTLRRKRLRDNLRDERARQGIRKPCRRHDTFTVPLFDTILSELSSSSSSEDDNKSGNTSWSSLLGANWRTLIDSDSNSTTSGSSDLLIDAELNSLPDLGSISGIDDEICEESSSEIQSNEWHNDMFMDPGADGDNEEDSDSEDEDEESRRLSGLVRQAIRHSYAHSEVPRDKMS